MPIKIKVIQRWMEARFPPNWAEPWDHIGLQLGDPEKEIDCLGVSLEATLRSVAWAVQKNLPLLICHHPLFFQPVYVLTNQQEPGRTALQLVQKEIALLVAHTNLDASPEGVGTALARRLGLMHLQPLEKQVQDLVKLVIFIPVGYEERIMQALDHTRAGQIGTYRLCTFKSRGEGTFMAETGSHPFSGEIGRLERASECRLEVQVPRTQLLAVIEKIRLAHPYEEMAYDVYPMENISPDVGLGRVGSFDPPLSGQDLIQRLKQEVDAPYLRVSGLIPLFIQKAGVCGGSGGSLIPKAIASGAEVFICGEIGYHPIVSNQGQPMCLIEIGHYPSEKWIIPVLADALKKASQEEGWGIEVLEDWQSGDPYTRIY